MLTFKHFQDRPTWAAAAGYSFNIIDCMSVATKYHSSFIEAFLGLTMEFLNTEVRELPLMLLSIIFFGALMSIYPLVFWVVGIVLYVICINNRKKHAGKLTDIAKNNIDGWLREFERKQRGRLV